MYIRTAVRFFFIYLRNIMSDFCIYLRKIIGVLFPTLAKSSLWTFSSMLLWVRSLKLHMVVTSTKLLIYTLKPFLVDLGIFSMSQENWKLLGVWVLWALLSVLYFFAMFSVIVLFPFWNSFITILAEIIMYWFSLPETMLYTHAYYQI